MLARWRVIQDDVEPLDGKVCGFVDADALFLRNEVEDVAATLTFAEAFPAIFAQRDAKLRRVVAFVQGTAARKAVVAADAEFLLETVMLKDLLHGDRRFDGAEVNESVSVGHMVSSFVVVWICSEGWERTV